MNIITYGIVLGHKRLGLTITIKWSSELNKDVWLFIGNQIYDIHWILNFIKVEKMLSSRYGSKVLQFHEVKVENWNFSIQLTLMTFKNKKLNLVFSIKIFSFWLLLFSFLKSKQRNSPCSFQLITAFKLIVTGEKTEWGKT